MQVCDALDYHALKMVPKDETTLPRYRSAFNFFRKIGPTRKTISTSERSPTSCWTRNPPCYMGGAGLYGLRRSDSDRMMLAATGFVINPKTSACGSTGCNTVYSSTYPYNPYLIPWTNSLFENGPATAMGIRAR